MNERVLIIGAGPAGIAAAIQLKRCGLEPWVFEKNKPGGVLYNARLVENYPGFPGGVSGEVLANFFVEQFEKNSIFIINEEVRDLLPDGGGFKAKTDNGDYSFKTAIIASGTVPKSHELTTEGDTEGRLFRDIVSLKALPGGAEIAVIGAGDAAFDYALSLAEVHRVTVLNRKTDNRCVNSLYLDFISSGIMEEKNIEVRLVKRTSDGLEINCLEDGKKTIIHADYLLIATGREPCVYFLEKLKPMLNSYLEDKRLFMAGDVANGRFRQTAMAVGDGVRAALEIHNFMSK